MHQCGRPREAGQSVQTYFSLPLAPPTGNKEKYGWLARLFVDQDEFEAMKTLSGRRAPRCDKDQFRAKMTVST